jgi:hypothetical protein
MTDRLTDETIGASMPSARRRSRVGHRQAALGELIAASPSQIALAQWLIGREVSYAGQVLPGPEAAQRACLKFGQRLAVLFTPVGSQALLSRAIHLARTNFPSFTEHRTARTVEILTQRLRASGSGGTSNSADAGLSAVFATLIALVMSFIGEDLTVRLLRDVWPELPMPQPSAGDRPSTDDVESNP